MNLRKGIISFALAATLLTGCDQADVSEWASPQIRVSLSDEFAAAGKSATVLDVVLEVKTLGGRDFSPEPITVDNATTSQVAFEVSVPADSTYIFSVRFTSSGNLVGEGATLSEVTLETTVVDITVLKANTSEPFIAFVPSEISTSVGSGSIAVAVRYYGVGRQTAGIAALLDVTGPTPRPFTIEGAELGFEDGGQFDAGWRFSPDVEGVQDIGTLRFSRGQSANFCVDAQADNVRLVDRDGKITTSPLHGVCITISQ